MDFDEFRKKKAAQKKAKKQREKQASEPTASGKKLDWIDGLGPAGHKNPKIKGFILGRYKKRRVDPNSLPDKPEGFETHRMGDEVPNALEEPRDEEEIERLKREQGLKKPDNFRRF